MSQIIYSVPVPYSQDVVEVYGESDMGWYEWRVRNYSGAVVLDTRNEGYGSAGVALRDALIEVTKGA